VERIGDQVRSQLSRFGPQGGMSELLDVWPAAVGEMVASNAWPARFARDGTLHVNTSSSSWAFELAQLAPTIAERLREKLGKTAPKALRFTVGHLPEPADREAEERRTEVPQPTAEALQRAAELAAQIEDEDLRERFRRAAALGLSRPSSDHSF